MLVHKKIGVWMDHSDAHFIEFSGHDKQSFKTINLNHLLKDMSKGKSKNLMHHKEEHQLKAYFQVIKDILKNYDEILLFGPTDAKIELEHELMSNPLFSKAMIHVVPADYMTEHQEHAMVSDFFEHKHAVA